MKYYEVKFTRHTSGGWKYNYRALKLTKKEVNKLFSDIFRQFQKRRDDITNVSIDRVELIRAKPYTEVHIYFRNCNSLFISIDGTW